MSEAYSRTAYASGTSVSGASDSKSSALDISKHTKGSLQIIWAGFDAFNATILLEGSNVPNPTSEADWTELDGSCFSLNIEADSRLYQLGPDACNCRWIRLNYDAADVSTGTFDWYLVLKRDA